MDHYWKQKLKFSIGDRKTWMSRVLVTPIIYSYQKRENVRILRMLLCVCVCVLYGPAVCVAVTVDMALACAARGWTLQDVLMHGQNCRHTADTEHSAVSLFSLLQLVSHCKQKQEQYRSNSNDSKVSDISTFA